MKKTLLTLVFAALLNSGLAFNVLAQQNRDAEKLRRNLVKILQGDNNKVKIKLTNGNTIKGNLTAVDVDSFTVIEDKTNNSRTIALADVKKVKMLKKKNVWVFVGIGAMILTIVGYARD